MLWTTTRDISSSSESTNNTALVSRLSFRFLWWCSQSAWKSVPQSSIKKEVPKCNSANFPCKVNDWAIQCDFCNYLIHINCNKLNYIDYKFLQISNDPWYCILCVAAKLFHFILQKVINIFPCAWVTFIIINSLKL